MHRESKKPSLIIESRDSVPCGYAPRAILASTDKKRLFVGCKDGSVTVLEIGGEAWSIPAEYNQRAIGALCELPGGSLLVGRSDGSIDQLFVGGKSARWDRWAHPHHEPHDAVRLIHLLEDREQPRVLVSHRYSGTYVRPLDGASETPTFIRTTADSAKQLSGTRLIVPYERNLLLATSRGEVWTWSGLLEDRAAPAIELWSTNERPGLVNDFALMERAGGPPAVLFATDLGVYWIHPVRDETSFRFHRLSLPGLGPVCMAITYSALDGHGFLWASDTRGDSHLFWQSLEAGRIEPNFLPAGVVNTGSQVVLATSWVENESVVFAQVRRNDQVALACCRVVETDARVASAGESIPQLYDRLLRSGSLEEIRALLMGRGEEGQASGWPGRAVLADFLEFLAGEEDGLPLLKEFLSDPSAAVAVGILKGREEVEAAVELWTNTFLGIINRLPGNRESLYLGILRWLGDLEQRCKELRLPGFETVTASVQKNMRFVRKWGLFGEANALRNSLVRPIRILGKQVDSGDAENPTPPIEALDLLTYESLLFYRGIDLLHEDARGFQRGRSAWSLSQLQDKDGSRWVAISWSLGGIELFELTGTGDDLDFDFQFALVPRGDAPTAREIYEVEPGATKGPRRSAESWQDARYGYSRSIHLGKIGTGDTERRYLLTAPARSSGLELSEYVYLYELSRDEQGRLTCELRGIERLPPDESVYRFLEIEAGLVVAGLRGSRGISTLVLLSVETDAGGALSLRLHPATRLDAARDPEENPNVDHAWRPRAYNRVWSLALLERAKETGALPELAVGCEGGEIWRVGLSSRRELERRGLRPAARMSSAVKALAFMELPVAKAPRGASAAASPANPGVVRVVAGGSDGSIMAWQEVVANGESNLVTLWATLERGGEITAIHPIGYKSNEDRLILVVSRSGRCVLFDDRSDLAPPITRKNSQPQRTRMPGGRRGRLRMPGSAVDSTTTALASLLLRDKLPGGESIWDEGTGRYAVMLAASESGRFRLYSLHFPRVIGNRKGQYNKILAQWWALVKKKRRGRLYENLRLADATYQAIRLPPLVLVRWFLDPGWTSEHVWKAPERWLMPRYLRPLIDLRAAWDAVEKEESSKIAERALGILLRNARRLGDLDLFQEVCALSLKRANFELINAAKSSGDGARLCQFVLVVFGVIENLLGRWVGARDWSESRARITVAKNMIDGDTFWHVLQRAAQEERAAKEGKIAASPFRDVLGKRIEAARQLVGKHDSLVSLETLRAINLSMTRLCKRFSLARGNRGEAWTPGPGPNKLEAYWPVFEPYFEALIYAAARVFRSPLELTDPLAHEYSRTFALTVCACPSAAIRIANRLTETQLVSDSRAEQDDLAERIKRQFDLLASLGIQVPKFARILFTTELRATEDRLDHPLKQVVDELDLDPSDALTPPSVSSLEKKVGRENAEDVYCLWRIYSVVRWLGGLATGLASDAGALDLSREAVLSQLKLLRQEDPLMERLYSHSRQRLVDMLEGLEKCVPARGKDRTADIRPDLVLGSSKISKWARESLDYLAMQYRNFEIFEPQYTIFRNVLARLDRVSSGFPQSASVQKSIALAILGHHLLEELDEQVFELEEIAQNLDPLMVWEFRDRNRTLTDETPSTRMTVAWRFAHYLLQRAYRAESIPKNLRALFGILEASQGANSSTQMILGRHLLAPFADRSYRPWDCGDLAQSEEKISARAFQCLHLILSELDQNDRKYAGNDAGLSGRPLVVREPTSEPNQIKLMINFKFGHSEEKLQRLKEAKAGNLQKPLSPHVKRETPSSGAGLYLANLAAAVVGWELKIERVVGRNPLCSCVFSLTRIRPEEESYDQGR
jgi:hypothetical protein